MIHVYCCGDNNVDIYEHQQVAYPGGCCVNAAASIARTGNKVTFVSTVGNDRLGRLLVESLSNLGVDVSRVHIIDHQTSWCKVNLVNGERVFGDGDRGAKKVNPISAEDVKKGQTGEFDIIYLSTDGFFTEDAWKQFGMSDIPAVCDFTNRWDIEKLRKNKDIFKYYYMSMDGHTEDEAHQILKQCVHEFGAKLVVGTMGMNGSLVYNGRRFYRQRAFFVEPLDTLGAGDTFLSTFTASYFDGLKFLKANAGKCGWDESSDYYRECEDKLIEKSLSTAALASAGNCMNYGGFGGGIPFDESMISRTKPEDIVT